jgi:hypothetical protein
MNEPSPSPWLRPGSADIGEEATWFTVEQANSALPLVSRVVSDIVQQDDRLQRLQEQRASLLKAGDQTAAESLERQGAEIAERIDELLDELSDVGCELEDPGTGLVDFRGRRNSREVLLCWKLGEPGVLFWHDLHAGFSGRRPVDEACE